ncbi:MAG: hypothetical protein JWO38_7762 [Gemmataceae bacterium]|nr:hypothetical protein [Gemmataceae bacterium]
MRTLLFGLMVFGGIGCTQLQPIGPMAKLKGLPKAAPLPGAEPDAAPPALVTVPAPRPVPPATLITADDVSPENPYASVGKFLDEIENDRKTTLPAPKTAEVSVYKGGVKQN